jgi:AcrR family transcriptional regulator
MPKETFFNLPEEKRQRLLDLAIAAFAENDYKNVSISEYVRAAGIAKGSFYQYFEDKQDLYLYLIEVAGQEKNAYFEKHPPPEEALGVFDYLRWLYAVGVQFEFSNPRLAQIGYRAIYGDAPLPTETRKILEDGGRLFFKSLIRQGIDTGSIRPDVDPDLAAFIFNAVFTDLGDYIVNRLDLDTQRLLQQFDSAETPAAEQIYTEVIEILEKGLGQSRQRPKKGRLAKRSKSK